MGSRVGASVLGLGVFVVLAVGSADPDKERTTQGVEVVPGRVDPLASPDTRPATPPPPEPPSMGNWRVGEDVDPMTDQKTTVARIEWDVKGWLSKPSITVRCHKNKTDVIYDFQESLTRTDIRAGFDPKATFRWDDEKPESRTFSEAEGVTTAVFSYQAIPDAKRLMAHDRLRIQFVAGLGGRITDLDADLRGGEVAIRQVAEACGWK